MEPDSLGPTKRWTDHSCRLQGVVRFDGGDVPRFRWILRRMVQRSSRPGDTRVDVDYRSVARGLTRRIRQLVQTGNGTKRDPCPPGAGSHRWADRDFARLGTRGNHVPRRP